MSKKQPNPIADKLWKLTEDKEVTTTPSFMDTLAPLLAMLYFSGALEGKDKKGLLPTDEMAANEAKVRGAASGIVGDIRPPGAVASQSIGLTPLLSGGSLTPEMILKILAGMPGMFSGF